MRFQELLDVLNRPQIDDDPTLDVEITAPISEDHRTIKPGGLFIARQGPNIDSHDLIAEAVARGAAAVIGERSPLNVTCSVPYAQVANAQMGIGLLAARYYDYPSRALTVIGVTGTDGKTTTTNLIYSILKTAQIKAGMISTVSAVIGDQESSTGLHVTTPSAPEVQMYLARMRDAGVTHCVLETTSHGLAQGRVNGVDYDIAMLTNITHEHLDFHGTFEHYREAKGLLFKNIGLSARKPGISKCAIVNADDPNADYFLRFPADHHYTYALKHGATLTCDPPLHAATGTRINLHGALEITINTQMVGDFNVQNIMAAVLVGYALGLNADQIRSGIEAMPAVPGRMERIDEGQNFLALVDFAHTPNALKVALTAARAMIAPGKHVIAVFGSAGLRDREKRRLMAETSAELADISIFTAEDPRTESLDAILQTMADGAVSKGGIEGKTFYRVRDRGAALARACGLAQPGDVVIACGKGHEQSMAFGTTEYKWDDRDALRAALRGSPDKTLPTASDAS